VAELTGGTMGRFFLDRVAERGDGVALREKDFGIWQRVTWNEYLTRVRRFALGLIALEFRRGDHLAILSENRRQWLYADLATICLGGVTVGVYPTSPYPEVHYVVRHSNARFVVCEDQEQTDKILEVIDDLPDLQSIIVIDMKGMRRYPREKIRSFDDVSAMGEALEREQPDRFREEVNKGDPEDLCIMVYTSGTTGPPKGAMINHRNVEAMTAATVDAIGATADDSVVSYLPLCHVAERIFSLFLPLYVGYTVNFAESVATIQSDLREIAPTIFLGVPRIWEKLQSGIRIKIREASFYRRWLFERCLAVGSQVAEKRLAHERAGPVLRLRWCAAYGLMLRALQNYIGLSKARFCFSAAAPISPEVIRFFHDIGIPVKEGYGMTETTGLSFIHMGDDIKIGTVGKPVSCIEFAVSPEGELLKRGDSVFMGYYRDDAATEKTFSDGWLRTGDMAAVDADGHVRIVDRKKDIIITSGGKNIAPSLIENALRDSPYIKEAVVVGEGRHFLAALIQIDFDNVGKWATDHHIPYTNFKNLSANPDVLDLIRGEVDAVNARFARVENIREFRLLTKELDHDDGEMTATMKVRRQSIYKKFAGEIEGIYGG
jgi:long-chain acyl-CoA synthetase